MQTHGPVNRQDASTPPPNRSPLSEPQAIDDAHPASSRPAVDSAAPEAVALPGIRPKSDAWAKGDWQPLPARTWRVFQLVGLLTATPPALLLWWLAERRLPAPWGDWSWLLPVAVLACAVWLSHKRHRWTFWTLDAHGFAVRRGRIWQWDTRVPMGRVQHIDLKRGPLERAFGLASLVVHTAGTRLAGLDLSGIDLADAERVRDLLAREVERRREDEDGDGEGEGEGDGDGDGDGDEAGEAGGGARDA